MIFSLSIVKPGQSVTVNVYEDRLASIVTKLTAAGWRIISRLRR